MIAFVDMAVMVEWQRPEQDMFEIHSGVACKLNPTHNTPVHLNIVPNIVPNIERAGRQ